MTRTFTAGLQLDGLSASTLLEGPMDGDAFLAHIEQVLVLTLAIGDTVMTDNRPAHKVAGVREAIEAAGGGLAYLPPYCPDINPIEIAFANSKPLCGLPRLERSMNYGQQPRRQSKGSYRQTAQITSPPQDTMQ